MKNSTILGIILLIAAGGGYYFYQSRKQTTTAPRGTTITSESVVPSSPTPPAGQAPAPAPATYAVLMDANGFSPAELAIKAGDTVTFKNDDTQNRWPASAVHPTHQTCPGFDALRPLAPGESYSYTFAAAKECPFHDHLIPALRGKITVSE